MSDAEHAQEPLTETDEDDLPGRFTRLGLSVPTGVSLLPRNILTAATQDELFHTPEMPGLKVRLRQAGVTVDRVEPDGVRFPYRDDRDSTLIVPVVFFGAAYLSGNANLLNVALGVLGNYVTDYFRGKAGNNRVVCEVHVEKTDKKALKRIKYDGPPDQFEKLIDAVKTAIDGSL